MLKVQEDLQCLFYTLLQSDPDEDMDSLVNNILTDLAITPSFNLSCKFEREVKPMYGPVELACVLSELVPLHQTMKNVQEGVQSAMRSLQFNYIVSTEEVHEYLSKIQRGITRRPYIDEPMVLYDLGKFLGFWVYRHHIRHDSQVSSRISKWCKCNNAAKRQEPMDALPTSVDDVLLFDLVEVPSFTQLAYFLPFLEHFTVESLPTANYRKDEHLFNMVYSVLKHRRDKHLRWMCSSMDMQVAFNTGAYAALIKIKGGYTEHTSQGPLFDLGYLITAFQFGKEGDFTC